MDNSVPTMDNLDEMDKVLETQNLLRLNHEETAHKNITITSKAIESAMKHLPTKESSGSDCFISELYQIFTEKLLSILPNFSKIQRKNTF